MRRILLPFVLAALLVLASGAAAPTVLRPLLVAQGAALLGGPFRVGEVSFDPLRARLVARDLALEEGSSTRAPLAIDEVEVPLRGWPWRLRPDRIVLHGVRGTGRESLLRRLRSGSSGEPPGFPILVTRGEFDLLAGEDEGARLEGAEIALRPDGRGGFRFEGTGAFLGGRVRFEGAGRGGTAEVRALWVLAEPTEGRLRSWRPRGAIRVLVEIGEAGTTATFEPDRLTFSWPEIGLRVENVRGRARLAGGEICFDLRGRLEGGELRAAGIARIGEGRVQSLEATVSATDIPLDHRWRSLAARDRTATEIAEALRPDGRADGIVRLRWSGPGHPVDFLGETTLRDLSVVFVGFEESETDERVGFPLPSKVDRARLWARADRAWVRCEGGRIGGADLGIEGEAFGPGRGGLDFEILAGDLPLDGAVRSALDSVPGGSAAWDEFRPGGRADVRVQVFRPPGARRARVALDLSPRGATAAFGDFPLPVEGLEGRVRLEAERLDLDLRGRAADGTIEVRGGLEGPRNPRLPRPRLSLLVRGRDLSSEGDLRETFAVLAPSAAPLAEDFDPKGRLDAEVRLGRGPGADAPDPDGLARISLRDLETRLPFLDRAASAVRGDAFLLLEGREASISADTLEGEVGGVPSFLRVAHGPGERGTTVEFRALAFPLDSSLAEAAARGIGATGASGTGLNVEGTADVEWRLRRTPTLEEEAGRLHLRAAALRTTNPPLAFEGLQGEVEVRGDAIRARGLEARLSGGRVRILEGALERVERGVKLRLDFTGEGIPLDERIEENLLPVLAAKRRALGLAGGIDLEEATIEIRLPEGEEAISLSATVVARLREVEMDPGVPVEALSGTLRLWDFVADDSGIRGRVGLEGASARIAGLETHALSAEGAFEGGACVLERIVASFYGGILDIPGPRAVVLPLEASEAFEATVRLRDVSLRELFESVARGPRQLSGKLDGQIRLERRPQGSGGLEGSGQIEVRDGSLFGVPVFRDVFDVLGVPAVFQYGRARFQVFDDRVEFPEVLLTHPLMEMKAEGRLAFDGTLDARVETRLSILPTIPLVSHLWRFVKGQVFPLRLQGPIESPRLLVEGMVGQVLGTEAQKRRPALPGPRSRPAFPRF